MQATYCYKCHQKVNCYCDCQRNYMLVLLCAAILITIGYVIMDSGMMNFGSVIGALGFCLALKGAFLCCERKTGKILGEKYDAYQVEQEQEFC